MTFRPPKQSSAEIRRILSRGCNADDWACNIIYRDKSGQRTLRIISPIRFTKDNVIALCCCRQEPRSFRISHIEHASLIPARDVQMPCDIAVLPSLNTEPPSTTP